MEWQELLKLEFERIFNSLKTVTDGLTVQDLNWQPQPDSNGIGWLIWHLTRWQDIQMTNLTKQEQLWMSDKLYEKFGRLANAQDTGMGHKPEDLANFKSPDVEVLLGYNWTVLTRIEKYFSTLKAEDLDETMDGTSFDPPPKVANGLVGLISDGMQHAGQAWYVRGLRQGMGWH